MRGHTPALLAVCERLSGTQFAGESEVVHPNQDARFIGVVKFHALLVISGKKKVIGVPVIISAALQHDKRIGQGGGHTVEGFVDKNTDTERMRFSHPFMAPVSVESISGVISAY